MSGMVLGIPHAGTALPPEVAANVLPHVDEAFLRSQSDGWTDLIYAVPWARTVVYPWSRYVADPNRAEDQRTEGGVLPVTDFDERPIYKPGREPGLHEHMARVLEYHRPYHEAVNAAVADPRTKFYIDGHSMMQTPPRRSPDFRRRRPDAVLGNRPPDKTANFGLGTALTCPEDLADYARERLAHLLRTLPAPEGPPESLPSGEVTLNDPFPGGYGVASHADPANGIPGLQVELNQRLWIVEETYEPIPGRIGWMAEVVATWAAELLAATPDR